jgi:predicted NBD/HSP70 family sugar kinase
MPGIDARQRDLLQLLWNVGRLSRWELHERTGVNPNAIGLDIGALLSIGIVRECDSERVGPGRPRVPVEIDPSQRHVVGLSINPGRVEVARVNLRGGLVGKVRRQESSKPQAIVTTGVELLKETVSPQTLSIGLSVTGFVDPIKQAILLSSSLSGQSASLSPIFEAAGSVPVVLENDMHALAARWLLTHQAESNEDVLLVRVSDGQLGAALLIDGRPNRGCATGANELGHTRFYVETDKCYCGHAGCLERICSTEFLPRVGIKEGTFMECAAGYDASSPNGMSHIIDYLGTGLSNAVNLIRPNRLVLVSELVRMPSFVNALLQRVRSGLLNQLVERVRIDMWDQPATQSAETAGWLALASLYREGWNG